MRPIHLAPLLVLAIVSASNPDAVAQGTRADYDRATRLRADSANKVFKSTLSPHWLPGNNRFWYRNDLADRTREFILVDIEKARRAPAFDHVRLATALAGAARHEVTPDRLPFDAISFPADDAAAIRFNAFDKGWRFVPDTGEIAEAKPIESTDSTLPSPPLPRPTRVTGPETQITFVNKTQSRVDVSWINTDGKRQRFHTLAPGASALQSTYQGHVWVTTDPSGKILGVFEATATNAQAVIGTPPGDPPTTRPQKRNDAPAVPSAPRPYTVFIRDYNVFLHEGKSEPVALTTEGTADNAYREPVHISPDGTKAVVQRTRKGDGRRVYIVESSPTDQLQPRLQFFDYDKPGDRLANSPPYLFDLAARKLIPIKLPIELTANAWSIGDFHWFPDSSRFTFLLNTRGHQALSVLSVDVATGSVQHIVDETSKTFIDYSGKFFCRHLDETGEIIWMSERSGYNHLYLYDARTGKAKNPITSGDWVVRGVDRVDPQARQIWFRAGGIIPGQDPYYVHFARVNFDGTHLVVLTEGDGTHTVAYSPDNRFLIDTCSRVDQPPIHELRRVEDGKLICPLERADASSLLRTGWKMPERFVAKGRDGKTDIFGVIWRPSNFDPALKYPVIENIYAGPQDSFVPKAFRDYFAQQSLAELGFILVQIDGMGTSNRSKAFHDVCWQNLKDAGFPDRIPWIRAAAAHEPAMDLTRVGIYGGSAGGQNALGALLFHGDFYKVAVADCGCHDNRLDKVWWNEQWMGFPIGPQYAASSNVAHAAKLTGKLLLIVGELDHNVDPASTMQVVNALEKANKDFDLIVMTGVGHGAAENPYGNRRRADFLVRNLLGVEPRSH